MGDLAVRVDPFAAQLGQGSSEPPLRLRVFCLRGIALRRDDQEARAAARGPLANPVQQRVAHDRFVREHKDVLGTCLRRHVDHDVFDGNAACAFADAIHDVLAQPAGLLLRVRCEDDLVHRRLELGERVTYRRHGIGLHDEPVRGDALVSEHRERPVEPSACCCPASVLVDDVAALRLADRCDDRHLEIGRVFSPLDRFDQLPPGNCFVGDDEQVHQWLLISSSVGARSPFKTAWRAPGTPYSYGFPTTCGISSKLKIGGGDETCHSSVSARQGFASAGAPRRMLMTML